jgi:uncharacterized repeat protein (TIGR03803 family)
MRSISNKTLSNLRWTRRTCALLLLCATTATVSKAQTFTTLYNFNGGAGYAPESLIQGTDGQLYGTADFGGCSSLFCGTAFKITPSGTLTLLYVFCTANGCTDGDVPGPLIEASDGNFYGGTQSGGSNNPYAGIIFKLTSAGALTTLYSFSGPDGSGPEGVMVQATDGSLYGTTVGGGSSSNCNGNCGTVFRITLAGALTSLHSFDLSDGATPFGLIQGTDGNLYGTTITGGTSSACSGGCGTVFKITTAGILTSLHSFIGADGENPDVHLVQAANGSFYGSTSGGGALGNGTIYKIASSGTLTTLHTFSGVDGAHPSSLLQAASGNFFGTTGTGGSNGGGTIFEMTPAGVLTTLYDLCGVSTCTDSNGPGGMIQDTDGKFYGTTQGGPNQCFNGPCGTIFSFSNGLHPFVETQQTSGKVGSTVKILGTNLNSATSVTFNGTAAVFEIVAGSLITATVPTGATTGYVKVTTASGTLVSNQRFRVTP